MDCQNNRKTTTRGFGLLTKLAISNCHHDGLRSNQLQNILWKYVCTRHYGGYLRVENCWARNVCAAAPAAGKLPRSFVAHFVVEMTMKVTSGRQCLLLRSPLLLAAKIDHHRKPLWSILAARWESLTTMTGGRWWWDIVHSLWRLLLVEPLQGSSCSTRIQDAVLPSSLRYGTVRLHDELPRILLFSSSLGTTRSTEQVFEGGLDWHDGMVGWMGKQARCSIFRTHCLIRRCMIRSACSSTSTTHH